MVYLGIVRIIVNFVVFGLAAGTAVRFHIIYRRNSAVQIAKWSGLLLFGVSIHLLGQGVLSLLTSLDVNVPFWMWSVTNLIEAALVIPLAWTIINDGGKT